MSSKDQGDVDQLNDDIRRLKQDNKKAFAERMRLEAQKNKLGRLCLSYSKKINVVDNK